MMTYYKNIIPFGIRNGYTNAYTKKEYDSESVYDKNYLKTKIKSHGDEVTDLYD